MAAVCATPVFAARAPARASAAKSAKSGALSRRALVLSVPAVLAGSAAGPAKAVAPVSSADVQYTNSEFGSAPGTAESKFGSRGGSRGGFEAKSRDSLGAKSRGSMDTR